MDIQRGDQVYYRGEVWTVVEMIPTVSHYTRLILERSDGRKYFGRMNVWKGEVQRVEQAR